jgi:hypothetical protein
MYVYINPIVSSEDEKAKKGERKIKEVARLFSSSDVESFANTISRPVLRFILFNSNCSRQAPGKM